jgi:hypothetical protein
MLECGLGFIIGVVFGVIITAVISVRNEDD